MIKKLKQFFAWDGGFIKGFELLLDLTIILAGFGLAVYVLNEVSGGSSVVEAFLDILRFIDNHIKENANFPFEKLLLLFTVSISTVAYLFYSFVMIRVYETSLLKRRFLNSMFAMFISLLIINTTFVVVVYVFPLSFPYIHEMVFIVAFFIQLGAMIVLKYPLWLLLKRKLKKPTIVVATKADATVIVTKILNDKNTFDKLKYIYYLEDEVITEELINLIDECKTVYISSEFETNIKNRLISHCIADRHKQVKLIPKLYEISLFKAETKNVDDKLMFNLKPLELSLEQRFFKRTFDIIVSGLGLIFSLPFIGLAWLLIKIDDRGPLFYSQERITKDNKPFKIYKVRSMRVSMSIDDNTKAAIKGDNRITKVGKFIRASRIDEIPQLWNVFKGEMSLVGPRPLVQREVDEFIANNPNFEYRANVKAGLMGYAQYAGKYTTSFEDKLRLDLLYIRNQNFWFDLKIIFGTILTIFDRDASGGWSDCGNLSTVLESKNLKQETISKNVIKIY